MLSKGPQEAVIKRSKQQLEATCAHLGGHITLYKWWCSSMRAFQTQERAKREPSQKTAAFEKAGCGWCVRVGACMCLLRALEAFVCRLRSQEVGEIDGGGRPQREE